MLRKDLLFQTCTDQENELGSSATISRFENSVERDALVNISKEMVEIFIAGHKRVPEELVLDFDPTNNKLHGHQEQRHYHGYYGEQCYLPLHVFCGDKLIVSMLRPSNIDGSKYAGAILRLLVKRFRQTWPKVKITMRGDCAFARKHIMHWCEKNDTGYVMGMPSNVRLQNMAVPFVEQLKEEGQRLFGDFFYSAGAWKCKRRVIVKTEYCTWGINTRFVITNKSESPQVLYENVYCLRGNMENHIKQLKLDLYSDRNSCKAFNANYFRLLLSSIAYILMTELKSSHLNITALAKVYCGNMRLKLIKIGTIVLKNTRRISCLISSTHPHHDDFYTALQSLVPG